MKEWIPIFEKLIWPFFIILGILFFRSEISGLYNMAVQDGRSIEIPGFFKLGEAVRETNINTFATRDLSVQALGESDLMVTKGSSGYLNTLQEQLRNSDKKSINLMKITNDRYYDKELLIRYVSALGVKHVIFEKDGAFDGWIESGMFTGQLFTSEESYFNYDELTGYIVGIKPYQVTGEEMTSEVLRKMKENEVDAIAVVDEGLFRYMINKQDVLSALISTALLAEEE